MEAIGALCTPCALHLKAYEVAVSPTPHAKAEPRAVLIDLDGTLVDTAPDFLVAINQMLDELGFPAIHLDQVKSLVGKGSEHLVRSVLALELGKEDVARYAEMALERYFFHYSAINGTFSTVYPGVVEGLEMFRRAGILLACVTNKPYRFAKELLAIKEILPMFDLIVGGDTVVRRKPDPLPLFHACEVLMIEPREAIVIGDSVNDVQASRRAGCCVLVVPYGYNHGEPAHALDSDGIVASLGDAARYLLGSRTSMVRSTCTSTRIGYGQWPEYGGAGHAGAGVADPLTLKVRARTDPYLIKSSRFLNTLNRGFSRKCTLRQS